MSEVYEPICVDKILVALDNSKHSFSALQIAVELAQHYGAALKGIFVEDATILKLAEISFLQEVGEYSATVRKISYDSITKGVTAQSRWVIRTFQKMINQADLQGTFSILRGNVFQSINLESDKCDLLVIGKTGTNPFRSHGLGSTSKALIQRLHKSMLLVEQDNHLGYPVIVLYDNSPEGKISLQTGKELLNNRESLIILLSEDDPDVFEKDKKELSKWASENKIDITIQTYKSKYFQRFIQMIKDVKTGLFIIPHNKKFLKSPIVENILANVSLPILLIRTMTRD